MRITAQMAVVLMLAVFIIACNRQQQPATADNGTTGDTETTVSAGAVEEPETNETKTAFPARPRTLKLNIPAGTPLRVRVDTPLSSRTAQRGDAFEGRLTEAVVVEGRDVLALGAPVSGTVSAVDKGGRVSGRASLSLRLNSIALPSGGSLSVSTPPVVRLAPATKKDDALKVGIGAGVGAAIGAIAGGGKGAAIGAGAGAAAGTGTVLATRGKDAVIPAEAKLSFQLSAGLAVEVPER